MLESKNFKRLTLKTEFVQEICSVHTVKYHFELSLNEHVSGKNIFWSTLIFFGLLLWAKAGKEKNTSHICTADLAQQRNLLQEAFRIDISQCELS